MSVTEQPVDIVATRNGGMGGPFVLGNMLCAQPGSILFICLPMLTLDTSVISMSRVRLLGLSSMER